MRERISPVHVPRKQIRKVTAGRGKNLSFWIKILCFWFVFWVQAIPQDFCTEHIAYQKENNKKGILSVGQNMRVSFSYTLSCIVLQCPASLLEQPSQAVTAQEHFSCEKTWISANWAHYQSAVEQIKQQDSSSDVLLAALLLLQVPACESSCCLRPTSR